MPPEHGPTMKLYLNHTRVITVNKKLINKKNSSSNTKKKHPEGGLFAQGSVRSCSNLAFGLSCSVVRAGPPRHNAINRLNRSAGGDKLKLWEDIGDVL